MYWLLSGSTPPSSGEAELSPLILISSSVESDTSVEADASLSDGFLSITSMIATSTSTITSGIAAMRIYFILSSAERLLPVLLLFCLMIQSSCPDCEARSILVFKYLRSILAKSGPNCNLYQKNTADNPKLKQIICDILTRYAIIRQRLILLSCNRPLKMYAAICQRPSILRHMYKILFVSVLKHLFNHPRQCKQRNRIGNNH